MLIHFFVGAVLLFLYVCAAYLYVGLLCLQEMTVSLGNGNYLFLDLVSLKLLPAIIAFIISEYVLANVDSLVCEQ